MQQKRRRTEDGDGEHCMEWFSSGMKMVREQCERRIDTAIAKEMETFRANNPDKQLRDLMARHDRESFASIIATLRDPHVRQHRTTTEFNNARKRIHAHLCNTGPSNASDFLFPVPAPAPAPQPAAEPEAAPAPTPTLAESDRESGVTDADDSILDRLVPFAAANTVSTLHAASDADHQYMDACRAAQFNVQSTMYQIMNRAMQEQLKLPAADRLKPEVLLRQAFGEFIASNTIMQRQTLNETVNKFIVATLAACTNGSINSTVAVYKL